jgi:hypothetical protein
MKRNLLKIENELLIVLDAYDGLQVLTGSASTDSEIVCPILMVINEKLKTEIERLGKAFREEDIEENPRNRL